MIYSYSDGPNAMRTGDCIIHIRTLANITAVRYGTRAAQQPENGAEIPRTCIPQGHDRGCAGICYPNLCAWCLCTALASQFERLSMFGWNMLNASASSKSWYLGNARNPMPLGDPNSIDALMRRLPNRIRYQHSINRSKTAILCRHLRQ
jgi:hypothetical protein